MPVKKHLSTVLPLMLFPLLLATGCQHVVSMDNYALTKADQNIIETYLAEEIIKPAYGGKIFSAHRVLLSDRQEGKIYLWAFIQEYYREIGELQKGTGVSVPVVLNVAEENNTLKSEASCRATAINSRRTLTACSLSKSENKSLIIPD